MYKVIKSSFTDNINEPLSRDNEYTLWRTIYNYLNSASVLPKDVRGHGSSYWMKPDVNILAQDYAHTITDRLEAEGIPNASYSALHMIPEKYQDIIFSYEDEFVDKAREIYSMTDAEAHAWNDKYHL